jgi:hypothetical protein
MRSRTTLVVLGMMGRTPFAGVAWQVLHYLEGLRRLGFDVYYVEDTGDWPYDAEQNTVSEDPGYTLRYIARLLDWMKIPDRWAYVAASQDNRVYGLPARELAGLYRRAAALVNLTGATVLRPEHQQVPVRIYLETDPVLPQIEVAQGRPFTIQMLDAHTHHFSYGENLGAPDCRVPLDRWHYLPTRQPIILDWWEPPARTPVVAGSPDLATAPDRRSPKGEWRGQETVPQQGDWREPPPPSPLPLFPAGRGARSGPRAPFTTIASWEQSGKDIEWQGETYHWSKHHEFLKVIDLPRRSDQPFELALACDDAEVLRMLRQSGWAVRDALGLSKDILPYREFIVGSRGEFTVAKDQNIRLRSGWFSDRSACYLAAGRPVITQDTAFGNVLPTGRGLFAFRNMEQILEALERINIDYEAHANAARAIAREFFAAERVLASLVKDAGL